MSQTASPHLAWSLSGAGAASASSYTPDFGSVVQEGQLLVMLAATGVSGDPISSWPEGWWAWDAYQQLGSAGPGHVRGAVTRYRAGMDTTPTFGCTTNSKPAWLMLAFDDETGMPVTSDYNPAGNPSGVWGCWVNASNVGSAGDDGGETYGYPNPPSLSHQYTGRKVTYVAWAAAYAAITAAPSGYSGLVTQASNGAYIAAAVLENSTASSSDPGTFSGGYGYWNAKTMVLCSCEGCAEMREVGPCNSSGSTGTEHTIVLPYGKPGDLLVAMITGDSEANTWTVPAGWVELVDSGGKLIAYKQLTARVTYGETATFTSSASITVAKDQRRCVSYGSNILLAGTATGSGTAARADCPSCSTSVPITQAEGLWIYGYIHALYAMSGGLGMYSAYSCTGDNASLQGNHQHVWTRGSGTSVYDPPGAWTGGGGNYKSWTFGILWQPLGGGWGVDI